MEEIAQQWRDGLITDTEFNMKMLDVFHRNAADYLRLMSECVSDMMKRDEERYWYRLERLGAKDYEYVKKSKMLLVTKEQATTLNASCLEGYRWHSTMTNVPAPEGDQTRLDHTNTHS